MPDETNIPVPIFYLENLIKYAENVEKMEGLKSFALIALIGYIHSLETIIKYHKDKQSQ